MLAGELGPVASAALTDGAAGLSRFALTVLRPVQPMLAQTADGVEDALARISPAAVEWKLDGARIQVHRLGDEVRVFTRTLADATDRVPGDRGGGSRAPRERAHPGRRGDRAPAGRRGRTRSR